MPKKTADAATPISLLIKFLPQRYEPAFPVGDLADHPKNPKDHDAGAIAESIDTNGFYGSLLVQDWKAEPNYILAGHGRKDDLVRRGVLTVPVLLVKCNPRTALRILLSDNRTSQLGGFDDNRLLQTLSELHASGDLEGTGYTADDLDDLRAITTPITFEPSTGSNDESIAYKLKEAIIVHVTDITKTPEVRAAIGKLLSEHTDWTAKIYSSE